MLEREEGVTDTERNRFLQGFVTLVCCGCVLERNIYDYKYEWWFIYNQIIFSGKWEIEEPKSNAMLGDLGLILKVSAVEMIGGTWEFLCVFSILQNAQLQVCYV